MSDALKRIEEKHAPVTSRPTSLLYGRCIVCDAKAPCNMVKLARALVHAMEWLKEEGCDCGTDEPGTCALCEAERVLWEVAG